MRIVLDTNVLVSALLSPHGPPAAVVRMLVSGQLSLCYDERIVSEYRDVLIRGRFAFDATLVDELVSFLEATGVPTLAGPLALELPDRFDAMFIEVAVASGAEYLVTGNLRHFPARSRHGVTVVSPREFIDAVIK